MTSDAGKLIVSLAAAVGAALVLFAREHGESVELPEFVPPNLDAIERAYWELQQWQGLKETDARAAPLLARYWAAVGLPPQPTSTPWSAAFISAVAGPGLSPSASHIGYTRLALRARQQRAWGRYWALAPNESGAQPVQRGDILVKYRGTPITWADVEQDTGHKDAHGDLVVDTTAGLLSLIGGNVSNAVTLSTLDSSHGLPGGYFAIVRKMQQPGVA